MLVHQSVGESYYTNSGTWWQFARNDDMLKPDVSTRQIELRHAVEKLREDFLSWATVFFRKK